MLKVRKILCPMDFSASSYLAILRAVELASQRDTTIILLHVQPFTTPVSAGKSGVDTSMPGDNCPAECYIGGNPTLTNMKDLVDRFLPRHLTFKPMIRQGDVVGEILRVAKAEDVDLIAMATHGASGWKEFALGSVTDEIVRMAPCPVLTLGKAARAKVHSDIARRLILQANDASHDSPDVGVQAAADIALAHDALRCRQREADFPIAGSPEDKLRFLVRYAILAPSNRNTQPWMWKISDETIELYADRMRALPHLDPEDRELVISCGAALQHLRIAIGHFGYDAELTVMPDPANTDLLARMVLGKELPAPNNEDELFEALTQRHTNRRLFLEREISLARLSQLQVEAVRENATLLIVDNPEARRAIIDLIARGDDIQSKDAQFLQEIMQWIRPIHDAKEDGIPEAALGADGVFSGSDGAVAESQADKDRLLAWSAPCFAVLETEGDTPKDWLAAGQALARVLLCASSYGIQASFFSSPLQVVELWPQLHRILGCNRMPQVLFRLGYPSHEASATPRRPVGDVVLTPAQ